MKYLIINTEAFSPKGVGRKKELLFPDLPWVIQKFLSVFKPFVILDESSKIKTNQPTKEINKSTRTRLIKLLGNYAGDKCIMTGTLMSKSPINIVDQYEFLGYKFENIYQFAEKYCIMMTIRVGRGRRVIISQKYWDEIRNRLKRNYAMGGEGQLRAAISAIYHDFGIRASNQEWIMKHKKYTPFINQDELMSRVAKDTIFIKRKDIFDIKHEKFVKEPISRPVELSAEAKRIGNQLVEIGFTDNFVLGKAAALELTTRLQDICNGFEPLKIDDRITHKPLKINPKIEELLELLDEIDVENNQVVIWSSRKLLIKAISSSLDIANIPYVTFDGDMTDEEKIVAKKKFLSGEARVFVANQASGAYGLDWLGDCSYMIWMCVDGSVERYYQAQHRILRGELKAPKFAYTIYAKGSVEERQWEALRVGQELIGAENKKEVFNFL